MMLNLIFIIIVLVLLRRQWKMRRILEFSRQIKNKYVALPLIGHGHMFLGTNEDRMKAFQKFAREAIKSKHGVTSLWMATKYYALISDATVAEIVSKRCLDKAEVLQRLSKHLIGNGLVFAPVDIWRARRKILIPAFSTKHVNYFVHEFAQQGLVFGACLKPMIEVGTFSVWHQILSYTMDSVCQMVLGVNVSTQGLSYHPLLNAFDEYSKITAKRICQNWLHWDPLYECLPIYAEAEKNKKIIHDFVDEVVRKKFKSLEQMDDNTDVSSPQKTTHLSFLDLLISASGGPINGYTNEELRDEAIVLIVAGTDTSAAGAAYTVLMLSRHLDVQERVYNEIYEIFGDSKRAATQEDLSRMIYTEAVIKESLRLYPPVPIIAKNIDKDIKLPSGITLPAGIHSIVNIWGINRNPRYWGQDADEFNPDRFLKGSLEHQAAFMTFSCGPRNCLGYKYATLSMKIVVSTMLRDYIVLPPSDIASKDLKKPLRLAFEIMMKDVDNFKIRLKHRN